LDQISYSGHPSVAWLLGTAGLPAHLDPDKPALTWAGTTLSFGTLRDRALRLASSLRAGGLHPGDRLATYLLNRGETIELYFACAYAGLTLVPINFRFSAEEVSLVLQDCAARWMFTQDELASSARDAAAATGGIYLTVLEPGSPGAAYTDLCGADPFAGPFPPVDPHLILFSSGTTGRPKGATLTHRAVLSYAMQQAALYPAYDSNLVLLVTGPLHNTGGINDLTMAALLVGGTVSILPSHNWSPQRMAEHIGQWSVTHTIVFPSMMEPMLQADADKPLGLATLKLVVTGGENCPPAIIDRFRRRWPHLTLAIGYGSTELGLATVIMDDEIDAHPGSVGRCAGGSAVRVVDESGHDAELGAIGEVWMAGGSSFSGYHNAPELTASTLRDGWVASGDLGRLDAAGYLYIEGRKKDMIISGGQNIYPAEIENVLSHFDHLLEAAVIGVPDQRWGEAVCAVVVAKPGTRVTREDVIAHVAGHLASYKKPKHVVFVDFLPRNASQKVLKNQLREQFAAIDS
jgi:fatty-acyl-CoA synthase